MGESNISSIGPATDVPFEDVYIEVNEDMCLLAGTSYIQIHLTSITFSVVYFSF